MRQRRTPARKSSGLGPMHHRGLWSQIIGGLVVAGVLAAVPLLWHRSPDVVPQPSPSDAAARVVAQLAPGVTLGRYQELLEGPPAILRPAGSFREAVWVADLYAVQAVLGPLDQVLGYSVTTSSAAFTPPLERLDAYRLGIARFGDIPEIIGNGDSTLVQSLDNGRGVWWYSEVIPPSGATHDDTIVLTSSDASDIDSGLADPAARLSAGGGTGTDRFERRAVADPMVAATRGQLVVTTYSVLGPQLSVDQLPDDFRFGATGADIDAVRPPH